MLHLYYELQVLSVLSSFYVINPLESQGKYLTYNFFFFPAVV